MKKLTNISLILLLFLSSTTLYAQNTPNYDYSTVSPNFSFTRDLSKGSRGQDVSYLQCILGIDPTGYFGDQTKGFLTQFQDDHREAVLTPAGLSSGTGYFGQSTRDYVNQQIAADGSLNATCGIGITGGANNNSSNQGSNSTNNQASTRPATVYCPAGYMCTPNPQNQQSGLASLLPLLPYLISQPGGGQRVVYPNQNNGTSNPNNNGQVAVNQNATGANGTVNSSANAGQNYMTAMTCVPPLSYNYITRKCESPATNTNNSNNGTTATTNNNPTSNSANTDPTFIGGKVLYNSSIDDKGNTYQPCIREGVHRFLIMVDNKYASSPTTRPLILLVDANQTKLNGQLLAGQSPYNISGDIAPALKKGTCLTGHYILNPGNQDTFCQDYTRSGYPHVGSTAWPIDGMLDNFNIPTGSDASAACPA